MRKILYCDTVGNLGSVGLLVLRVLMGVAFMFHGWDKIQNPMGWLTVHAGDQAPPAILQAAAAVSEFCGGAALIVGLLTRLACLGIGATMAVAMQFHIANNDPFVASAPGQGSYEPAAVYLACSIMFLLVGPGRLSLDALLFGGREPATTVGHV